MKFVANIALVFFFVILILFMTGCSTSMTDKRISILQELQDAGCKIETYNERFGRSIIVKCNNNLVGDSL